jgi:hypothetical protein
VTLRLGPLLRWVGETEATVWVEATRPCTVEVLGASARTFAVAGRHYALVHVSGLPNGEATPYEVRLDGERVWPLPGAAPSRIRTLNRALPTRVVFGSCRACQSDRGADALALLSERIARADVEDWPDALLMLGDQVYADDVSPETRAFIRRRRDASQPPGETVADFEEYAELYREAWSEPRVRWLLSTIPSAMIFDDHDVHDDWNTSEAWVEQMRAKPWWEKRILGAYASYWIYQHVGNLAPDDLASDPTWAAVRAHADDATEVLSELAYTAQHEVRGTRWSFARELGPARLVMIDSRAGRVLTPGRRSMLDDGEWDWLAEHARGDVEHLLLGTSLPWLLAPGMHYAEAWSEAVCDGAWGGLAARTGERLRQAFDLEHWAAFDESFDRLAELVRAVGAGERGAPPRSIVALSGDVHHAYLAEVGFPRGSGVRAPVWQAVCSPMRNPLGHERHALRTAWSRPVAAAWRALARRAGVADPSIRWRLVHDRPWFDNQLGTLVLDGGRARLVLETAGEGGLEPVFSHPLTMA